jgi:hypothetical protein
MHVYLASSFPPFGGPLAAPANDALDLPSFPLVAVEIGEAR